MNNFSNDRSEEEWMQKKLLALQDMPGLERSPAAEKAGQSRFLSEAASLRKAVPAGHAYRQQGLWGTLRAFLTGKQARLAFSAATAMVIVAGIMLASGGTVVFASQGSQPGQILYPVKLISENVRLDLADSPQNQFELNMEFAGRRLDEIDNLVQAGKDPAAQVTDRLQTELNAAFDSAANLDNSGAVKALENLQANLLKHQNQLLKLQSQANPHAVANYTRVVEMLQQKVDLAGQGIKDPQTIRKMLKQQDKQDKQSSKVTPTPLAAKNNPGNTGTPIPAATTPAVATELVTTATSEPKNNPAQCNNPNKSNNGNGNGNSNNNGNGNGNPCNEPGTQLTVPTTQPAQPDAATSAPKPDNPNKPVKTPKDHSNNGNKGGNGHKK
jgi:hypothetical protein